MIMKLNIIGIALLLATGVQTAYAKHYLQPVNDCRQAGCPDGQICTNNKPGPARKDDPFTCRDKNEPFYKLLKNKKFLNLKQQNPYPCGFDKKNTKEQKNNNKLSGKMCAVTIKVDGKDISCDLIINNADEFKKKYHKYFSQQAELQVECD